MWYTLEVKTAKGWEFVAQATSLAALVKAVRAMRAERDRRPVRLRPVHSKPTPWHRRPGESTEHALARTALRIYR